MAETADLIFMPYNYVLDGRVRMTMSSICWQGAVVIFDEAHNVEARAVGAWISPSWKTCPHEVLHGVPSMAVPGTRLAGTSSPAHSQLGT